MPPDRACGTPHRPDYWVPPDTKMEGRMTRPGARRSGFGCQMAVLPPRADVCA
ncbi:MAG: hypothetical protein JRM85_09005 [Nitrososphaerota archaeon]|nr:hypothetical protein [Nitrososphaerota archaeon]